MKHSKITKLAVISIGSGENLGEIVDLVIDYDNGKCLALLVQPESILAAKKIVLIDDVGNFGDDAVMVPDEKAVVPLKDNEDIVRVVGSKVKIIGNEAVTYSGEQLGEVKDYAIDGTSYKLAKLFVSTGLFKDLFRGELAVTANQIISIGKDAIIVKDAVVSAGARSESKKEQEGLARVGVLNKDVKTEP